MSAPDLSPLKRRSLFFSNSTATWTETYCFVEDNAVSLAYHLGEIIAHRLKMLPPDTRVSYIRMGDEEPMELAIVRGSGFPVIERSL